jgi:hypothetical protein
MRVPDKTLKHSEFLDAASQLWVKRIQIQFFPLNLTRAPHLSRGVAASTGYLSWQSCCHHGEYKKRRSVRKSVVPTSQQIRCFSGTKISSLEMLRKRNVGKMGTFQCWKVKIHTVTTATTTRMNLKSTSVQQYFRKLIYLKIKVWQRNQ